MPENTSPVTLKKPLSTWEKVKTGTVSFVKSGLHYIPRGLVLSAVTLGAGAVIANMGGWDILNTKSLESVGDVVRRVGMIAGIGTLITGSVGAFRGITEANKQRGEEIRQQELALQREQERARGQERELTGGEQPEIVLPQGIPQAQAVLQR